MKHITVKTKDTSTKVGKNPKPPVEMPITNKALKNGEKFSR